MNPNRALAVFAIATLLPSSVAAQQSTVCDSVMGSTYLSSPGVTERIDRDALAISESIAEILVENLPEAWSCENNPNATAWLLWGVTVGSVDDSDGRRRRFNAYLTYYTWLPEGALATPLIALVATNQSSVRDVTEDFELKIRRIHRIWIDLVQEGQR